MDRAAGVANDLIFISIASYRDAQLVPTIRDCFAKARHPDRLRFGICWQHGEDEQALPFVEHEHLRILDVDWRQSRGACWARAEIMKLWRGEAYFLQVDSHCRFAPAWDEKMIAEAAETGSARPILSTYAAPFTPSPDSMHREVLAGGPNLMAIQAFTPEGLPQLKPIEIPGWRERTQPLRARFLAAGFLFTLGRFVQEVGYDPELYFFGEEISMTLRAYTHGYDLFHPRQSLVWHDYVRSYAVRHWDDHTSEKQVDRGWDVLDTRSRDKVNRMLRGEAVGSYGLGTARTLADYEAYAGLSFQSHKLQDYTRRSLEPPNPPAHSDWEKQIYSWMVRVMIEPKQLTDAAFDNPMFWYVTLHDEEGREIYRRDFPGSELKIVTKDESKIALVCEMESGIIPVSWTVWPVNAAGTWLTRIKGTLADDDYAIIREEDQPGRD